MLIRKNKFIRFCILIKKTGKKLQLIFGQTDM